MLLSRNDFYPGFLINGNHLMITTTIIITKVVTNDGNGYGKQPDTQMSARKNQGETFFLRGT